MSVTNHTPHPLQKPWQIRARKAVGRNPHTDTSYRLFAAKEISEKVPFALAQPDYAQDWERGRRARVQTWGLSRVPRPHLQGSSPRPSPRNLFQRGLSHALKRGMTHTQTPNTQNPTPPPPPKLSQVCTKYDGGDLEGKRTKDVQQSQSTVGPATTNRQENSEASSAGTGKKHLRVPHIAPKRETPPLPPPLRKKKKGLEKKHTWTVQCGRPYSLSRRGLSFFSSILLSANHKPFENTRDP